MAKTQEQIESEIAGLQKAFNDSTTELDALKKAPKADPAKVESLAADLAKLAADLLTLKTATPASGEPGFFDAMGKFLDGIFG